jgi:hypothetical protein
MTVDAPTLSPSARLPGPWAWTAAIGVALSLLLLFAALLVSLRLEKALADLVEARALLVAQQLGDAVEGGLRFGVPLADQTETPRKMQALAQNDPALEHMALLDDQGRTVVRHAAANVAPTLEPRQLLRLMARKAGGTALAPRKVWREGPHFHVLVQVRDASGFASGAVWVVYSALGPQTTFDDSLHTLGGWALAMAAGVTLLLSALLAWLSRRMTAALDPLAHAATPGAPWPVLPVPQALDTLARLESELSRLSPPATGEEQP